MLECSVVIDIPENPRILFTRTDAMGDLILATPAIRETKRAFPRAEISFLCREYTAPLLANNPHLSEVIEVKDESCSNVDKVAKHLKSRNFDLAIAIYPSKFTARVLRAAEIPIRIGSGRRLISMLFTHRIYKSRKNNLRNEAECNFDLLEPLNVPVGSLAPEVFLTSDERSWGADRLKEFAKLGPSVILHPGSDGSAFDWTLANFLELARNLSSDGIVAIFTGSEQEARIINEAAKRAGLEINSLAGETDLRQLAAVLNAADLVVANSTGPLHLAAAVGTATVGIFPDSPEMSPRRWAPPVDNTVILTPDCGGSGKPGF
ncbi:MAG: glycosyltransferase family 9 protein, partial [candidate division Zixibacteria bacterium]|nr:glycosyltransferase family 9 protein [candidate division Zixibacteria bacterium]